MLRELNFTYRSNNLEKKTKENKLSLFLISNFKIYTHHKNKYRPIKLLLLK